MISDMGSESINDICILLVATELPFIRKTLDLLLKANYRVVFNCKGDDALSRLKAGKRKVDLVLTETNLPDMCGFMFIQIVDIEFKLPVVMISETYDEPTFLRGLLNGAMYCLAKPLCEEDIKDLWRYPILKGRDVSGKSSVFSKSGVTDKESGINVVKEIEVAKEPCEFENSCDGHPSNFIWTPHDLTRFLEIIFELGIHNANAMEILRRIDTPGLTTHIAVVKLQEFRLYLKQQGVLPSKTNSCFPNPLFIGNHEQLYGGFQYMGTNQIIRNQKLLVMGFLQNPPDLDEDDEEMSFFDWLKDYGVYADPFPRFCDAMASSTTLLGRVPPITYVLQKMSEPRANSPQSCMQPNYSTTVTEVPPVAPFERQENGHVVQSLPALPMLCQSSYPSDTDPPEVGESVGSSLDESLDEIPKGASY